MEIDNDRVNDRETYMLHLAALSVGLRKLDELQIVAFDRGLFNEDEIEGAKTIRFEVMRLLTVINDQIRMGTDRTGLSWEELKAKVVAMAAEMGKKTKSGGKKK